MWSLYKRSGVKRPGEHSLPARAPPFRDKEADMYPFEAGALRPSLTTIFVPLLAPFCSYFAVALPHGSHAALKC